ncbi:MULTISPECIES: CPXCG motif-containing cysteine-rich protein [unclassified Pseudoalteromonas]|uniref:CPXCG motif-containing cysteine-rich protein n=1 Tax=unclassified Pseudoalteromonas TaxID=194690 RepID=UPI0023588940|nr:MULTISPECIES: CPXCG motif-containing cysteine-rich protein [unclassified Pseudoalteromonas]MDC9565524.1 CPXCG motif-containing cysteine-rich protein [Pseudoalteromonas sp. GAB2316C]MDC9569855.1 CPXCG motif-containing cysteine-rich protein [Pseudoalteromonas sp. GABNB9D]MDC9573966.1 CPXCG motif-containing cysteine-rich protein [Pseudoalteromonas sp. GABNS16A]MDC9578372.1 CPXCG motif-containing cysteine-rich protein [Pseudoalteromonas sp. GABNS16E]MDC9586010.1 CPXCG motif-containing cysteine-
MNQLTEKSIGCPYCGESIEVLLDAADTGEQYIEDCQVCCKPISFVVFEDEDELKVNVYSEDDTF